jgi:hypothetical protein
MAVVHRPSGGLYEFIGLAAAVAAASLHELKLRAVG